MLRGLLLTGGAPTFMRAEIAGGGGDASVTSGEALWWPPGKIVGRYLAPFLAEHAGVILTPPERTHSVAIDVEVTPAVSTVRS